MVTPRALEAGGQRAAAAAAAVEPTRVFSKGSVPRFNSCPLRLRSRGFGPGHPPSPPTRRHSNSCPELGSFQFWQDLIRTSFPLPARATPLPV